MAFWKFYKRLRWFRPYDKYPDMIYHYKNYVLKSEEERKLARKRADECILKMLTATCMMKNIGGGTYI